jgi:hypothetical protein
VTGCSPPSATGSAHDRLQVPAGRRHRRLHGVTLAAAVGGARRTGPVRRRPLPERHPRLPPHRPSVVGRPHAVRDRARRRDRRGCDEGRRPAGTAAARLCHRPATTLRRTVRIALVVGVPRTAVNQVDVIARGDATAITWIKCGGTSWSPSSSPTWGCSAGPPVHAKCRDGQRSGREGDRQAAPGGSRSRRSVARALEALVSDQLLERVPSDSSRLRLSIQTAVP